MMMWQSLIHRNQIHPIPFPLSKVRTTHTNPFAQLTPPQHRKKEAASPFAPEKEMASLSAVSMATPITGSKTTTTFFTPLPIKPHRVGVMGHKPRARAVRVQASLKEKALTGLTAAALTASMMAPDVAQAAELSPSLKNFLLSIASGGVVLGAIFGAVIAVANFDPVKRV